jgi:pSer/pThr/pTyr-binding forkhead associated (FHA) protein
MARLRITSGPSAGRTVVIEGELTLGREHADLTIEDPEVSRSHAVLRVVDGGLEVQDLGSANGTFVDGQRVNGSLRVTADAQVQVGMTELALEEVAPAGVTRLRPIADLETTRVRPIADPQATQARRVPSPPPPAAGSAATESSAPAAVVAPARRPAVPGPVGTFSPPVHRRGVSLATRSWLPAVLSYGSVVATAIALVVYFAAR